LLISSIPRQHLRALIIGGTGFIGSHILSALESHETAVFHRGSTIPELAGDRNDPAAVARAVHAFRPDAVLDCILSDGDQAAQLSLSCEAGPDG
jgi:nucleoside-diphosphate-sugar epimerase